MHWRSFVVWNALGGTLWATAIGLLAYFLGHSAGGAVEAFGVYGLLALLLAILSALILHRRHARHGRHTPEE
jgi:membrane protein DedA with SNARE-associated domain